MKEKRWEKPKLTKHKILNGKVEINGKSIDLSNILEMSTVKSEGDKVNLKKRRYHL